MSPAQHPAIARVISASPLTGMFRPICDVTVVVGFFYFFPKVNLLSKLNLSLRHILSLPPLLSSSFLTGAVGFLVLPQRLKIERTGRVFRASKNAVCTSVVSSLTFLKNGIEAFLGNLAYRTNLCNVFFGGCTPEPPRSKAPYPRTLRWIISLRHNQFVFKPPLSKINVPRFENVISHPGLDFVLFGEHLKL